MKHYIHIFVRTMILCKLIYIYLGLVNVLCTSIHYNPIEILIYSTPCMMLDLERRGMKMLHIILLLSPILYHRYNTYVTGLETRVNSILLRVALVIELQYTVQPRIPPGIPEPGLH